MIFYLSFKKSPYLNVNIFYKFLISEVLSNKNDCVSALWLISEKVDVVADTFWRVAVVAHSVGLTRGFYVEAFCMEGDGFAVNVPEGTTPESVIYNVGGVPQMFQIN